MRTQTSPWSTTRTSLAMPSGLRLRSSLSGSGKTSLNWSQTSNWSHLQQLKQRKERTWRKRVGVEPTPESAKDTGYGFEDHEDHRALCGFAGRHLLHTAPGGANRPVVLLVLTTIDRVLRGIGGWFDSH